MRKREKRWEEAMKIAAMGHDLVRNLERSIPCAR